MSESSEPGWYSDPERVYHARYWDGKAWTARVADSSGATAIHHLTDQFLPPGTPPPTATGAAANSAPPPSRADYEGTAAAPSHGIPSPPSAPPSPSVTATTTGSGTRDTGMLRNERDRFRPTAPVREDAPEYHGLRATTNQQPSRFTANPTAHRLRSASAFLRRLVMIVSILSAVGWVIIAISVGSQTDAYGDANTGAGWVFLLAGIFGTLLWAAPLYVFALLADGQAEIIDQLRSNSTRG